MSDRLDLYHPQLRDMPAARRILASSWFNFFLPADQRIHWYGDAIRPGGGNGLYCTQALYDAWPNKSSAGDIVAGPK